MSAGAAPLPDHGPGSAGTAVARIADLLLSRTGLAHGPSRIADLETGIRRAMGRSGLAGVEAYSEGLLAEGPRGGRLLDDLLGEVTVGETYFFREPQHFDLLRKEVLPDLLGRRSDGSPLRLWSAGCATGEEPYSLAILLEEEGLADRTRILATDICRAAIARAWEGVYGKWALRASDEAFTRRYFSRQGDQFRLDSRFRGRVAFEYLNLAFDSYPSFALDVWGMDVVFCRNVFIYFDTATIRRAAGCLFASLAEGGWLVTGPSDPLLTDHAPFETVVTAAGVFYRRPLSDRTAPEREVYSPPARPPPDLPAPQPSRVRLPRPIPPPRPVSARLSEPPMDEAAPCALRIKALANTSGARVAAEAAAWDSAKYPLSAELHFVHAVLLISLGHDEEAVRGLRRVLYLDRSLAVAHFVLGSLLARRGEVAGALSAYRNARDLAASRPAEELLPLSDGEPAGRLAEGAAAQAALLVPSNEAVR